MKASRVNLDERVEVFERLLSDLTKIVRKSGTELDEEGREVLRSGVRCAVSWYGALQFTADDVSEITLHDLKKSLPTVIEILKRPANEDAISFALGAHKPGYCDFELGVERRKALIDDLEKIAAIRPPSRRRGAPGNPDLHHLVHSLANYWLVITGRRFTQMWTDDGTPVTDAAEFVYKVVAFVDRDNLKALPQMMKRVISERRRGIVMPWLTLTSGK